MTQKPRIIIGILILLIAGQVKTYACDICGCGVGNAYIGILPDFQQKVFGIRYRTNAIQTHIGAGGTVSYLTTQEHYRTIESWAGWNFSKRFRVMVNLPYHLNEKFNQRLKQSKQGLGDISVAGYYELINKRTKQNSKLLVQSLWVGTAIKFATGQYNPADKNVATQNANLFQLGTGSTDFSLHAMYDIRLNDIGLNANTMYKLNTVNSYQYKYGNKWSSSVQAYYKFRIKGKWLLAPNAGIQYEQSARDSDNKLEVNISGGNLLQGTIGIESGAGKLSIGANWQTPLHQNLMGGVVKAENRVMVHVSCGL